MRVQWFSIGLSNSLPRGPQAEKTQRRSQPIVLLCAFEFWCTGLLPWPRGGLFLPCCLPALLVMLVSHATVRAVAWVLGITSSAGGGCQEHIRRGHGCTPRVCCWEWWGLVPCYSEQQTQVACVLQERPLETRPSVTPDDTEAGKSSVLAFGHFPPYLLL